MPAARSEQSLEGLDLLHKIRHLYQKLLDSRGFITLMTPTQALKSIQVMGDNLHNWYDEAIPKERINDSSDNVDSIQGGQLSAASVLEVENFTNWKKRFMCHIIGIEPQFEIIISNDPFIPMAAGKNKPNAQWTTDKRNAANLDQHLKILIMSILLDDQMNSIINYLTTKSTWDDLILYQEGLFDVNESRVMYLKLCYNTFKFKEGESLTQTFTRYKALMNELVNDGIKLSKLEINTSFINGLPKKWLSFCQSLRNTNHVKESELASLFDTDGVPSNESQRNTTDPLVVSSDSLATDYDSADESLVCSTPHLSLKKLDGAEPVSGPKTIKSILKSKSTFKAETLKSIAINEPFSASARRKSSSASKTNSAPAYSAKALENSKVFFSIPTGGIFKEVRVNTFRNTIGAHYQPHPSKYVASPSIDVVRQWFPMNGYGEEVSAKGTLNKNLLPPSSNLIQEAFNFSKTTLCVQQSGKKGGTSKAPSGSKTGHSKKRKESSLAIDSNPSQPLVFTPVDTEMHKEDQQATGGPTSLGVTSEARANSQLSSGMSAFNLNDPIYLASFIIHSESALGNDASATSTIKADLRNSAPSDFVPQQQDLDSPKDDLIIFVNDSDEVYATENVKTEDTLVPKSSSPRLKENTKCVSAANEELTAARHKLKLLV
nr:retrovirus-related Pol polyprotein from transposon TNT 1-94 [Tanacetum cinerariifolium]